MSEHSDRRDWRLAAACRGATDAEARLAYGAEAQQVWFASSFCRGCQVQGPCLKLAMRAEQDRPTARFGVFGGLIPLQRRVLQLLGGPVTCRCGVRFFATRTNQLWCPRCTERHRIARANRSAAQTSRLDTLGRREHGSRAGYRQHTRRGEDPCGPCQVANTAYYAAARRAVA